MEISGIRKTITDLSEPATDRAAADFSASVPDWAMLAVTVGLVICWLLWIGIATYELMQRS